MRATAPARTVAASAPTDLAAQPPERLHRMAAAGAELLEIHRLLAKTGDNVVGELLRGAGTFYQWEHYPKGDAYDAETHAQYYYHAHPPEQRFPREHGHFHTFLRPFGMPAGIRPAPTASGRPKGGGNEALSHLVAVAMDDRGRPLRLFTVNRWVTGETWYRAADVTAMLDCFAVEQIRPSWAVNRWLTALLRLYVPQIEQLLAARDAAVAAWARSHPSAEVLDDRRLEITSWIDIDPAVQLDAVRQALAVRGG